MSDQATKSSAAVKPALRDRKKRSWLRIFLWILLFIIIGIVILVGLIWINRYSLVERQAQRELAKAGIEAEFDIESVNRSQAVLNDIELKDERGPFFSADRLVVDYRFEQVRAGIVDKLIITDPVLKITLDENGDIADSWLPKPGNNENTVIFPKDGIHIENGEFNWTAPWGDGSALVEANINSETNWESHIQVKNGNFKDQDVEFIYRFAGNIDRINPNEMTVKGTFDFPSARVRQSSTGPFHSDFNIRLTTQEGSDVVGASGRMDFEIADIVLPAFAGESINLDLDLNARLDPATMTAESVNANWELSGQALSMTDREMRTRLVRRTMSYDTLSKTPIAMHFADEFERNGKAFFESFSADGSGTYAHAKSGYEIEFAEALVLKSNQQTVVLKPDLRPEVKFRADERKIDLDMHVDWDSSRDLNLKNLKLQGQSENGLLLKGVDQVSVDVSSRETWHREINAEKFRLAPLDINLNFENTPQGSRVNMRGDVDYDGLLPGGSVTKLRTGGRVGVSTRNGNFALSFDPSGTIKMDEFLSSTGWRGENVSFDLVEGKNVLRRIGNIQPFKSQLSNVRADIVSPENDRHLRADFEQMMINSDFRADPQIWNMDVNGIEMNSDDFPSPGTHIQSSAGTAKITQFEDGAIEFRITSPETQIDTNNVQVADLFIEMQGRPDDFSANYKAGNVQLIGGDIPEVPMQGTARLRSGILTGTAVAPMPKTKNTPINIEYRSEDGVGSAHIAIPKVVFTPRGLQPQYLIPALRGKLAEVSGEASAEFDFTFGDGGPVRSNGTTTLKNMDIGTLVGPASGVSAELTFKSMFPLETDGVQTATLTGFDAGFPLENGTVKFEIVPDGIRIDQAEWPVISAEHGDGTIYISPMLWRFGNVENQAVVNVENLSLGELLKDVGNGSLSATGQISGRLPATVNGVNVEIKEGVLAVKDGGVIRYRNQGLDTFAKGGGAPGYLGEEFDGSGTGFAFRALENFQYKELEARINGPLDGEMLLRMRFGGKNPDVLSGTAFEFNVGVSGELANIVRESIGAFDAQKHLDSVIDMQREAGENSE